jgi:hypothetical protein
MVKKTYGHDMVKKKIYTRYGRVGARGIFIDMLGQQ